MWKYKYDRVLEAIDFYNRYHSPEATATLIKFEDNIFRILFEGPFCRSCGVIDWIEDFTYILKDFGMQVKINNVEELDRGILVDFMLE